MTSSITPILVRIRSGEATAADLESSTLDFKTVGRSRQDTLIDLAEACACFANSRGGTVVVGVADTDCGQGAFRGVGDLDPERTQSRIYELTEPHLLVDARVEDAGAGPVMVLTVPRSPEVHQVRGRATERVGSSCVPMSAARITEVVAARRGHDWSKDPSGLHMEAVPARAWDEVRRLLARSADDERPRWAQLSEGDLVRRLGLLDEGSRTLNNAGAVLLTGVGLPGLSYIHRRGGAGTLTVNELLDGPAVVTIVRVLEMIEARNSRTPVHLEAGQQLHIADLPDLAVREAIVNAAVHRDYALPGTIQVEQSQTRLSVSSPGGFLDGVSPENILTISSRPRNPALAAAARHLGLAESAGVGVDRMYGAMIAVGHSPPTFSGAGGVVTATLHGGAPNTVVTRFVVSLPPEQRDDTDLLLVLFALLTSRTVKAENLTETLQKGAGEVEDVLRRLASGDVGLIERTRQTQVHRQGVYRLTAEVLTALGSAVAYRRVTGDQIDQKVITIVREAGTVNARLVKSVLDLDQPTCSRVLAGLVERGVLVKTSIAQRGPSVAYGPGPQFPSRSGRRR